MILHLYAPGLLMGGGAVVAPPVISAELTGTVMRRNTLDAQVTRRAELTGTVTRR